MLTEVVSLFCTLVIKVFGSIQAAPEKARVGFGLTTGDVQSFELSTHPIDPTIGSFSGKKIPAEDKTFWMSTFNQSRHGLTAVASPQAVGCPTSGRHSNASVTHRFL